MPVIGRATVTEVDLLIDSQSEAGQNNKQDKGSTKRTGRESVGVRVPEWTFLLRRVLFPRFNEMTRPELPVLAPSGGLLPCPSRPFLAPQPPFLI
jgi:hypothetical protein